MADNVTGEILENTAEEAKKALMTIYEGDAIEFTMGKKSYLGIAGAAAAGVAIFYGVKTVVVKGGKFIHNMWESGKEKRAAKKEKKALLKKAKEEEK